MTRSSRSNATPLRSVHSNRSEEHTSELQSLRHLVCRLLLEKILIHLIKNFSLMSNLASDHELRHFREQPELIDVKRLCINLSNDFQPQAQERKIFFIIDGHPRKSTFFPKRFLSI